jgi:hypothetical protein
MRKLRLDVETLEVESFHTPPQQSRSGTVHGYDTQDCPATEWYTCAGETCVGNVRTCWDSCDGFCGTYFCG